MPDTPTTTPGVAQTIRSLVQPDRGRPLAGLSTLTDEQLRSIVLWMKEGKSNELIARTIIDLWGRCTAIPWSELQHALYQFRERIFAKGIEIADNPELLFDPLAENATFVYELKAELRAWNERIKGGKPEKAVLEHIGRLGKLLADTIANHANIGAKIGKTGDNKGDGKSAQAPINIEKCQVVFNALASQNMPDFLGKVQRELEAIATKKATPVKPRPRQIDDESTKGR